MILRIIFLTAIFSSISAYRSPNVLVETISNGGFEVSIPDSPDIRNVAFNININKPFRSFEPGEISVQIKKAQNNKWLYKSDQFIKNGDIIYVWTNIQHKTLVYRSSAQSITIIDATSQRQTPPTVPTNEYTCEPSISSGIDGQFICKGQLLFEDNFDNELSLRNWMQEIRLPYDGADVEFVLYENRTKVINGILNIEPILWTDYRNTDINVGYLDLGSRCTEFQSIDKLCRKEPYGFTVLPPIVSARVKTKSFIFQYGRIDIRAKLPIGDWIIPLLLLEPINGHGISTNGQIRIALARGNLNLIDQQGDILDGRTLNAGILSLDDTTRKIVHNYVNKKNPNTHFGEDYHVYSLQRTQRDLSFFVDNLAYGVIDLPTDQKYFMTLGISVGGHSDFPDSRSKPWANTSPKAQLDFWKHRNNWKPTWTNPSLNVDYVRVTAI